MTLEQIIQILTNKVVSLSQLRESAIRSGDLEKVNQIEVEIAETQSTLDILKSAQA